jgi:hypothetical protein
MSLWLVIASARIVVVRAKDIDGAESAIDPNAHGRILTVSEIPTKTRRGGVVLQEPRG